jgi:hypothetical protein
MANRNQSGHIPKSRRPTTRHQALPDAPPPPAGMLAAQVRSWHAFWESDDAARVGTAGLADLTRLWETLDDRARSRAQFNKQKLTAGSMGQTVLHPLAAHIAKQDHEVRQLRRRLGLGAAKVAPAPVSPVYLLARINARYPTLDNPEFGGFDMGLWGDALEYLDAVRLAASMLRDGKPLADLEPHRNAATAANEANEALLLAEWERMQAEAAAHLPYTVEGSPEELRLRALADVLREKLDEAAERGVDFAQAAPWRRAELMTIEPAGTRARTKKQEPPRR